MTTNNSWNSQDPAQVSKGGTGVASTTTYAVLCGGTTTTNPIQSIAGVGTSGQVLTSNGAAALPTFQDAGGGGGGGWELVTTAVASNDATIDFTGMTEENVYKLVIDTLTAGTDNALVYLRVSDDNGSTFATVDYQWYDTGEHSVEAQINLSGEGVGNATGEFGFSSSIIFYNINVASQPMMCTSQGVSQTNVGDIKYGSVCGISADDSNGGSTDEIDAIRIIMSTGNIATGNFYLYKLVTS